MGGMMKLSMISHMQSRLKKLLRVLRRQVLLIPKLPVVSQINRQEDIVVNVETTDPVSDEFTDDFAYGIDQEEIAADMQAKYPIF